MKVTERTEQVKYLSVAFTRRSLRLVTPFRERLVALLERLPDQRGNHQIEIHHHDNWLVVFTGTFPERELDQLLSTVATELGAKIFINPGVPLQELTPDESSFSSAIYPRLRRPNN